MTRLNLVLFLVVMATALILVRVQYQSRRLATEIDRVRQQGYGLDVELDRLNAQKRSQVTPERVEREARNKLGMNTITPAVTQYVRLDDHNRAVLIEVAKTGGQTLSKPEVKSVP